MTALEALEDMVYQFGYRGVKDNRPMITTGGLSALESAFEALGWDDPHYVPEDGNTCDVAGCMTDITSGEFWEDMYLRLCFAHSRMKREGKKRPKIKDYAIKREANRDKVTGFLNK